MKPVMIPLETLLRWLWEDNPKLHQDVLIQYSMTTHGFNDRVGVCSKFTLILEGHGRIGNLKRMKDLMQQGDTSVKMPMNIELDEVLGDWLVPCDDHDQFESREAAYQYALIHNRSGTTGLDLRDYDVSKLQRAIAKAGAGQQLGFEIPGFGNGDFADASMSLGTTAGTPASAGATPGGPAPVATVGQLPKAAVFDPSALSDAPGYQANQAPQSYVVMVTAPDAVAFQRVLSTLTLGERRQLPEGARFASIESNKYIEEWTKYLVNKEALVFPEAKEGTDKPLPGQLTLAGDVVEDPSLTDLVLMVGVDAAQGKDTTATMVVPPEPVTIVEPAWDADGNCLKCLGKGYTGTRLVSQQVYKIYCTACNAAGTRSIWLEAKGVQAHADLADSSAGAVG